ncbi:MAG: electron transport complex subunit RsxC [Candidatus Makaraimicrobium thalassicum]|nr:MAG: electron transport complex subunit RsxC [Candidatus Omnitrophota bacterium]
MKALTFPGGVHPPYYKAISMSEPLRGAPLPLIAVIPLSQHIGAPNEPLVKKGDHVEEGQVLGKSGSFVSSPVHSPVYGKVLEIKKAFHPVMGPTLSVFIERNKNKEPRGYVEQDVEEFSPRELIEKIRNAGVVGMGGAAFPTHVKLSVPEGKKIETLIINGAECEPYLTCDHAVMTRRTQEILKGIEIVIRILQPKNTYIAIEDNKKSAIFAFQRMIKESTYKALLGIQVVLLKTKYPQGGEKQLIKAISGREVPPGKLPLDIGFLVQNVGTLYAIYEAVYFNKPLIERVVTISGDCLNRPGNYFVKIGATVRDIVEQYGVELYREPKKIIVGGPMMGFAQPHMDVPILKNTSGILFLSEQRARYFEERQCIKCARCVDVCPVNLVPTDIMKNVRKGYWDRLEKLHVTDCIECGACMYSCPARIPLVQYIKDAKSVIEGRK